MGFLCYFAQFCQFREKSLEFRILRCILCTVAAPEMSAEVHYRKLRDKIMRAVSYEFSRHCTCKHFDSEMVAGRLYGACAISWPLPLPPLYLCPPASWKSPYDIWKLQGWTWSTKIKQRKLRRRICPSQWQRRLQAICQQAASNMAIQQAIRHKPRHMAKSSRV